MNLTRAMGTVISSGKASMAELSTVLGGRDLYDILEVLVIDAENQRRAQRAAEAKRKQQQRGRV